MDLATRRVVHFDRFQKLDWSLQLQRIKAALDRYNHAQVLVDSTGKGEPVFEELLREGCYVEPYTFTQRTKADLIDNLALMLERGEVTLPRYELAPTLIDELEAFEYSISDAGNTRTGAPSGWHDDCVIALALAAWKARVHARPIIASVGPRRRTVDLTNRALRARMRRR